MIATLLWYIFREMGKTFLLTSIGLTLLLSLGGGVTNLLKGEGLGTIEVLRVLTFVVPGAFTLSLPVAGLFSAAMAYGRLTADNEINACRAGGINVHLLLVPVLTLGLVIAAVTFWFSNYLIPEYVKDLNRLVGKNAFRIVMRELVTRGTFEFRGNVIHVDRIDSVQSDDSDPEGTTQRFYALGGAFMELKGDRPVRVATTEGLVAEFDKAGARPRIRATLSNVLGFDLEKNQFYEAEEQPFGPVQIPAIGMSLKPKWMNLRELRHYRRQPGELPAIRDTLHGLRSLLRRYLFFVWFTERLQSDEKMARIGDDQTWYEVRAEKISTDRLTARPRLLRPRIIEHTPDRTREISAELGTVDADVSPIETVPLASIKLEGSISIIDSTDPSQTIHKATVALPGVPVPAQILDEEHSYTDELLLDQDRELALGNQIANVRTGLLADLRREVLRMGSVLHSRSAFSLSVLPTMILGACLGIVFRGGHVMTAFGISFAPALFVIATIAMGKQVSEHPHTVILGIGIIWGAVLAVILIDLVVLYKGIRR